MKRPLRISINATRIDGPWGGGNRFVGVLERHLVEQGHSVVRDLRPGLDAILMIGVQRGLRIVSYGPDEVRDYLLTHPRTAAVLRVNNCDQAKGRDEGINRQMIAAGAAADHVVFCSAFSQRLYAEAGMPADVPQSVILTGADEAVFYPVEDSAARRWTPGQPLKLITHHWSTGMLKGFDVYERVDALLDEPGVAEKLSLTYIGKRSPGMSLPRSRWREPMDGPEIAEQLRAHHVLLTGARHEAGGNHYIEAMRCGLPVLYLESGANAEYCAPYGLGFRPHQLEAKLAALPDVYPDLVKAVRHGPHPASAMARQYERMLQAAVDQRRAQPRDDAGWRQHGRLLLRKTRRRLRRRLPIVTLRWDNTNKTTPTTRVAPSDTAKKRPEPETADRRHPQSPVIASGDAGAPGGEAERGE